MVTRTRLRTDPNWWIVALAVLSILISGYVGYQNNDKTLSVHVATLQAQEDDRSARLDRMETKLDTLLFYITGLKAPKDH